MGPVLRGRLISAGLPSPTSIQREAFAPISKGQNALLAAQTGLACMLKKYRPAGSTALAILTA